jgi:polysaccharide export outer membrane protein
VRGVLLRCFRLVSVLVGGAVLAGCVGEAYEIRSDGERVDLAGRSAEERAQASAAVAEALHGQVKAYRLRVGDSVEVTYAINPTPTDTPYETHPGDVLTVRGMDPADPNRADQVRVMPDGTLSLPEVERISVAGRSLAEARAALAARYARVYTAPNIVLALEEGTLDADLFMRDLGEGPGARQVLQILPDGTVTLPRAGAVPAVDLTLGELAARLDRAYAEVGLPLLTRVSLASGSGVRTFVMGEVREPGMYTTDRPITVLLAVGMAGGTTTSAQPEATRVVYMTADGEPRLRRLDLDRLRGMARLEEDVVLTGDAVIYVPPSLLSQASRYADQISNSIGFFQGFTTGLGGLGLNQNY